MLRASLAAVFLSSLLLLNACSTRSDDTGITVVVDPDNDFLLFPNAHASLGVGDYDVVLTNTSFPSNPTPWTLTIIYSDGTSASSSGTWTMNNHMVTQPIEVNRAGGIVILLNSGGATATLILRNAGATSVIASAAAAVNPSITLSRFQIDQTAYAQAYYAEIDPLNERHTLAKFKAKNGFGPCDYEVRFRDVLDLGYGRHMCARRNVMTGDIAVWVENFQVTAIPAQFYGPLNLEAVINDDRRWHIGTNAIEYSPTPNSGAMKVVKFYTFAPDGTRRLAVDLDGKGAKAMPVPCISCHGGTAWPLTATGAFPTIGVFSRGDVRAQMQPINVDTLDFSADFPYRRVDQEAALKGINQYVLCSYPLPLFTPTPTGNAEDDCRSVSMLFSEWQGTTAEMIKAWYGGPGMPNAAASDTFVPMGWTDAGAGVAGAQNLYQTVVATYCRVCHALRGNANLPGASDIDFTSYDKFVGGAGFTSRIKYHVYDRGNMPLALLKFNQFWESTAPATLAPFIPGAIDGSGNVLQPARPVAIPGPNRTVRTGVAAKLSAAESVNASSYRWRITSANFANATLVNANSVRPTFTATMDDTYILELIVNNGIRDSDPATLTIVASNTFTDPATIRFSHIRDILQSNGVSPPTICLSCHVNPDPSEPVYFDDYDRDGGGIGASDLHQFYLDIRGRINFANVESSRLLQRPSGNHHPGGLLAGFDASLAPGAANRVHYDTFLNWILNGAPE